MKTILIIAVAALLSGDAFSQGRASAEPGDVTTEIDTVKQKTRRFWVKAKGYLSDDKAAFTEGARQTLADLGKDVDKIAAKAGLTAPIYFQTRLQALRQQHEYLSLKLPELTAETIKTRMSGPRHAFDQCIGSLEKAIDQADDEADALLKAGMEKREALR